MTGAYRAAECAIVFAGQSLNSLPAAYPGQLLTTLAATYGITPTRLNIWEAGVGWVPQSSGFRLARLDPTLRTAEINVLSMVGGTQDYINGVTGAACYAAQVTYSARAKVINPAAIVLGTTTHPSGSITAGNETERQDGNSRVMADASNAFDYSVDVAADPRLDDPTDLTYYNADQIHLTNAGGAVMAELMAVPFATILAAFL